MLNEEARTRTRLTKPLGEGLIGYYWYGNPTIYDIQQRLGELEDLEENLSFSVGLKDEAMEYITQGLEITIKIRRDEDETAV